MSRHRILVTGADGQLGRELRGALPRMAMSSPTDRGTLDLADADAIVSECAR